MDIEQKQELLRLAVRIRIGAIEEFKSRGFGHIGGSLSIADALAVLYGAEMKICPENPQWEERDKLVCSKGHAGPGVYAALALKGYFPYEELKTLNQPGTNLPSHCDRNKTRGVDMTTGSLGQGTSLAVGMALGDRLKGRGSRVFLVVGDGELNEGQPWEAFQFAAANKISNLVVLIDNNKKQLDGYTKDVLDTGDLCEKMTAFGFCASRIDGNDVEAVYEALEKTRDGGQKPYAIILDTVKGYGIREIEETMNNHSMNVSEEQCDKWLAFLRDELDRLEAGR